MAPAPSSVTWTFFLLSGLVFAAFFVATRLISARGSDRRHAWGSSAGPKGTGHPGDSWARATVCIAIGAVVPIVAFAFTWLASQSPRVDDAVWLVPMVVTLVCVVSASLLARSLFDSGQRTVRAEGVIPGESKPSLDEDAFDVVSRRG
jgi:hypothetical protein